MENERIREQDDHKTLSTRALAVSRSYRKCQPEIMMLSLRICRQHELGQVTEKLAENTQENHCIQRPSRSKNIHKRDQSVKGEEVCTRLHVLVQLALTARTSVCEKEQGTDKGVPVCRSRILLSGSVTLGHNKLQPATYQQEAGREENRLQEPLPNLANY